MVTTFSHIGVRTDLAPLTDIVTVSEAAKILGNSQRYIRAECTRGNITARKTDDGVWLILRSSLKAPYLKGTHS